MAVLAQALASPHEYLEAQIRVRRIEVIFWLAALLPRYAQAWKIDYVSFRPQEEEGRRLSPRQRNDLLHTDAVPHAVLSGQFVLEQKP